MILFFEIANNFLSVAVRDKKDRILFLNFLDDVTDKKVDEFLDNIPKFKFNEVLLIQSQVNFSLCPMGADKKAFQDYYQLKYTLGENQKLKTIDNQKFGIKIIFAKEEWLEKKITGKYGRCDFVFDLNFYLNQLSNRNLWQIILSKSEILLLGTQNKKLLLANRFSIKQIDECIYFLMSSIQQKEVDQATCKVEILGSSDAGEILKAQLEPYFQKVEIINKTLDFKQYKATEGDKSFVNQNFILQNI